MNETFKLIDGYEDYLISDKGRVWSNKSQRFLKPHLNKYGYYVVGLISEREKKSFLVHRLVAMAFIPNPDKLPIINHKDEVKTNNCVDNLEWCTNDYNIHYGTAIQKVRISKQTKLNDPKTSKKVYQYKKNDTLVYEWPSISEAERNGYSKANIISCCNGRRETHKGYKWSFSSSLS